MANQNGVLVPTFQSANDDKWSPELMGAGWVSMPSTIIEFHRELGMDAVDLVIVLYLATFWWTKHQRPFPAKSTMAQALGVCARTIQRRIAAMESKRLVSREERRSPGKGSNTNLYNLDGLIQASKPLAARRMARMAISKSIHLQKLNGNT